MRGFPSKAPSSVFLRFFSSFLQLEYYRALWGSKGESVLDFASYKGEESKNGLENN